MMNTQISAREDRLRVLVDRVIDAVLGESFAKVHSVARSIHDARRLQQANDPHGALSVLGGIDICGATERDARWAYAEWIALARRTFPAADSMVYSRGARRAAVVMPGPGDQLTVAAAIGLRWQPGKCVPRRSLRGLRPLDGSIR